MQWVKQASGVGFYACFAFWILLKMWFWHCLLWLSILIKSPFGFCCRVINNIYVIVLCDAVICYAVWSLQMWSEHCLWWSEGPPSPLVRNTKQRVRSNPARCTCRPQKHKTPGAKHRFTKEKISKKKLKYKKQRLGVNRWFPAKMQMRNVNPTASKLFQCH